MIGITKSSFYYELLVSLLHIAWSLLNAYMKNKWLVPTLFYYYDASVTYNNVHSYLWPDVQKPAFTDIRFLTFLYSKLCYLTI